MVSKKLHLYVGIGKCLSDEQVSSIVKIVQDRHPEALKEEIFEGYWSGVEESTLLYEMETTNDYLLGTVSMIDNMHLDTFVAIDEPSD